MYNIEDREKNRFILISSVRWRPRTESSMIVKGSRLFCAADGFCIQRANFPFSGKPKFIACFRQEHPPTSLTLFSVICHSSTDGQVKIELVSCNNNISRWNITKEMPSSSTVYTCTGVPIGRRGRFPSSRFGSQNRLLRWPWGRARLRIHGYHDLCEHLGARLPQCLCVNCCWHYCVCLP